MNCRRFLRHALQTAIPAWLLLLTFGTASAQIVTPFGPRFTTNVAGDITYIGNSLQTCPPTVATCAAGRLGTASPIENNNNTYSMIQIDVDTDATTFNSSRAALTLPDGATVLFAGLYWGADLSAGSGGIAAVNAAQANSVRLQVPGQTGYQTINGSRIGTTGNNYASFANITSIVQSAGNGAYTVANVQSGTGGNRYAGWTIVLVYQAPGQTPRNLAVFDGYANVSNTTTVTIPISGFTAPLAGTVNARVGAVTFEGDVGLTGDRLRLNGNDLSNSLNPADNFFNSTFSLLGTRYASKTPDYPNLMAVDADLLNTSGIIANGATSATVALTTSGDAYFPVVVTTAIDLYAPNVSSGKSVNDLNGGQLVPGDILEYTISVSNSGQDPASNVVLTDPIPAGTTYVPGSLQVVSGANTGAKTDASGDDQAEYVAAQSFVRFRLGSGANAVQGGTLTTSGANASTTLRFRVRVNPDAANATSISNQAQLSYNAATLGTPLTGSTNVSQLPVATPVLVLDKTSAPEPVLAGGELVYTLSFRNAGSAPANSPTLTDVLPPNTTFISATGGGTYNAGMNTVTWNFGSLPPGNNGAVTVRVQVASPLPNGTVLDNTATLSAANAASTTSSISSTVASAPFLTLSKAASETVVGGGDKLIYTMSFSNAGTDTATSVVLLDTLPGNTTFVSASGGGVHDVGNGTVSWSLGNVPAGASGSVTLVVQIVTPTPNGALIENTATISASNAPNASATATSTASTEPVLILEKTASPNPVLAGNSLAYSLAFRNIGTDIAQNVVLTETIPANTIFVSATGGGTYDATSNTVTWMLGSIGVENGGSVALTVQIGSPLPNGTWIMNSASIASDQTLPVSANTQTIVSSQPQLSLTKNSNATTVQAGSDVVYTFNYANSGTDQAGNAVLVDELPSNTSFVGASAGGTYDAATRTVTWSLGAIAAGTSGSVSLTLRIDTPLPNGTVITNVGSLAADNALPVSASSSITVLSAPVLSLQKTATPEPVAAGSQITYQLAYANTGSDAATDTVIGDPLPLNTTFVSASAGGTYDAGTNTVTWNLGNVPAGTGGSVSLIVSVDSPLDDGTRIRNTATINCNEIPPTASSTQTTVRSAPNLSILKTADRTPVTAGDALTYTLTIANTGNANASAVVIEDALPIEATYVSASNSGSFDTSNNTVRWLLAALNAGETRQLTLVVNVATPLPNGTVLANRASIDSEQTIPVGVELDVPVTSSPVLTLQKSADGNPVQAGQSLTYTLSYGNTGNDSALNVVLSDIVPSGTTFAAASNGGIFDVGTGRVTWNLGTLPAGSSGTVTMTVQVVAPITNGTQILNAAGINADNAQPASASITTTANSAPSLVLTKQVDANLVPPGATLSYTLAYSNNGTDQANNTVIVDVIPINTTFLSASAGGVYDGVSNTVTWSVGNMPAGAGGSVSLSVQVASPLPDGTLILNNADINADNAQPVIASASSTVTSSPALTLAKNIDEPSASPGDTLTFTLDYGNTGDDTAFNVTLVDALPANVDFVSATGGGTYDPASGLITWNIGTLTAGATGSVSLVLQLPTPFPNGSVIANNATLSSDNGAPVSAQASTIVESAPLLVVTKTASQDPIPAGGQLIYTIEVSNNGDDDASQVVINDPLPANTTFVSANAGGTYDAATTSVNWLFETLPAGTSQTVSVTVQIASPLANGTIIGNSVTASANGSPPSIGVVDVVVSSAPVLSLTKSANADPVQPGQSLTYTLTYGNGGDDSAVNAQLVDTVPANTTFVSASDGGVFDGGANTVTWSLATVPAGTGGSRTLIVTVDNPLADGTLIDNSATMTADNAASTIANVSVTVDSNPVLSLTKVASQNPVRPGDIIEYTLAYANNGDDVANNVLIVDPVPANVTFVSASAGGAYDPDSDTVTWTIGSLPAGTAGSVTMTVQVASPLPNGISIRNDAQALAANATPANATAVVIVDSAASLTLTKTALANPVAPGETLSFSLNYGNNGTDVAIDAVVSDPLPANTTFVSASDGGTYDDATNTVTWNLGDLSPGASGTLSLTVRLNSPLANGTTIINTATLSALGLTPSTASASSVVTSAGVLTLAKSASANPVQPGQTVIYTLAYENTGDDEATNATIVDPLPAGTVFASASNGGTFDAMTNQVQWSLGTIPAGGSGTVNLTVQIASPLSNGKPISNNATLTADGLPPASAGVVIIVNSAPVLTLTKTASQNPVRPGTNVTYTLIYGNSGNDTAVDTVVVDTLPANTAFVSASAGGSFDPGTGDVTWSLGDVPPGASGSLELVVQVDSPLANGTLIQNIANASADNGGSADANATIVVDSDAVLSLTKTASTSTASPGDTVVFTLAYSNTGDDTATNATLVDELPVNMTFVSASDGGIYDAPNNTVTWPLGNLAPGASGTRMLNLQIASPLPNGTSIVNTATLSADAMPSTVATASIGITSAAGLTLSKIASQNPVTPGMTLIYTLSYANIGNDAAENAVIRDPLPSGVNFTSASAGGSYDPATRTVTWLLGTVSAGATGSVTLIVQVEESLPDGTSIVNTGNLVADGLPPVASSVSVDVDSAAVLTLAKSSTSTTVSAGDIVTFVLAYANTGNDSAGNVTVVDTIPESTTFVSASDGGSYDPATGIVTWSLGTLTAGVTGNVSLTLQVDSPLASPMVITNVARISGNDLPPVSASASISVTGEPSALTLTKSATPSPVSAGALLTYILDYSVNGSGTTTNALIVDALPTGTSFVSASDGGVFDAASSTVSWALGDLAPGTTGNVTLVVRVDAGIAQGSILENTAQFSADDVSDVAAAVSTPVISGVPTGNPQPIPLSSPIGLCLILLMLLATGGWRIRQTR